MEKKANKENKQTYTSNCWELALMSAEQGVFRELIWMRLEELNPATFEEAYNITKEIAELTEDFLLLEAYSLAYEFTKDVVSLEKLKQDSETLARIKEYVNNLDKQ